MDPATLETLDVFDAASLVRVRAHAGIKRRPARPALDKLETATAYFMAAERRARADPLVHNGGGVRPRIHDVTC